MLKFYGQDLLHRGHAQPAQYPDSAAPSHPMDPNEHPTFDNLWTLGEFDVKGEPRVQGNRVDMGAFETSDVIFQNSFTANIEL